MPLRLKSLELQGYKTFASKTTFEFAEGITAIVGPNGSGKSNIADSLRWVLGEQSYGLLRAKKTEDMIFNGSESRPRAGMASVTVIFDNSDGWLPVDFSEVAMTRRAYRDGRNDYLLNGQHVRLRDLNELLAQSGLSERTYTILGQGLVDASLALKADERRRLFEDAAGIGLYRSRRDEALKRLEITKRNLERVLDILAELEPRLKSLERQARRTQDYLQVQADLKLLLREWYGYHWHTSQRELADARVVAHSQEVRLTEARENYQNLLSGFSASRIRLADLRARLSGWNRQSAQLLVQRETISRDLAVLDERHRALVESRHQSLAELERIGIDIERENNRLVDVENEEIRIRAELFEARAQEQDSRTTLSIRQGDRSAIEEKLQASRQQLSTLNSEKAQYQARLDELKNRIENEKIRLRSTDLAIAQAGIALKLAEAELAKTTGLREQAELAHVQGEQILTKINQQLENIESNRQKQLDERNKRLTECSRLQAQLDVLDRAEQSLTVYADGARTLLEAARQSRLSGIRGALSTVLDVPAELELAIAAALGDSLDAVIVSSGVDVEAALSLLDSDSTGRATLLPLEWLDSRKPLKPPSDNASLGIASQLVQAPGELRPAVDLLLGQSIIVRDRTSARRVLKSSDAHRVVTLKGEVFRSDGSVQAGRENRSASISRPRQRREIQDLIGNAQIGLSSLNLAIDKLVSEHSIAHKELENAEQSLKETRFSLNEAIAGHQQAELAVESARRQRDWQVSQNETLTTDLTRAEEENTRLSSTLGEVEGKLGEVHADIRNINGELVSLDLDEFNNQVVFWNTRAQVSERAVAEAEKRLEERKQALVRLDSLQQNLVARINEIDMSMNALDTEKISLLDGEHGLNRQLADLRTSIDPAEQELVSAEQAEMALQEKETAGLRSLQIVERQNNQVQLDLARKQEAIENLRRRIEDDFGLVLFEYEVPMEGAVPLPLGDMVETLPVINELVPGLEDSLAQKKAQLRRMGSINIEAQQEYEQTLDRFNYMSAQIEDLREAEVDLRQVIAELDELTKKEFTKTFEEVAARFKEIFVRLFGGGSARLVLTDPDNLTETGIDIEAKLPGKREQGLSLLSGGERSLTAIALVFALLKVSPTPVCVMDEVDAMLDEANVGRFRDLLVELSQDTQFVIITHNRNTVQAADVIYGITMGRDSASQTISLKLDEVTEEMLRQI
jgi:chromosome segregation protein